MSTPFALTAVTSALCTAALGLTGAPVATGSGGASPAAASAQEASAASARDHGRAPTVVAHRGASGYAPENTLAAADAAAELGIEWVEYDVQRTKDGELIALHDVTLNRTTDAAEVFPHRAPWNAGDFTAEEIALLDAGSWFGEEYAGEPVPTFEELLDRLLEHDQRLLLELKDPARYPGIEAQILNELDGHDWLTPERVADGLVIQSFDGDSVRAAHQLAPEVKTGFLGTPAVTELPYYATFADQINPRHADVSAAYVAAVKAFQGPRGQPLEVFTWTVNDPRTARVVAGHGVDGIISDVPDVIRDAVGR